ncbi:MAG: hypothetical protein JW973_08325 [Bacteroidales bacterium]|nr:hypothetical protein [Bacteroidales bacterium]
MDDIIELIIYIAIGVVGLLVSIYRNRQKRQSQQRRMSGEIRTQPESEVQPDLGPLAEIFGVPEMDVPRPVYATETKEQGIEDDGYLIEKDEFSVEKADGKPDQPYDTIEREGLDAEKADYEGTPVFESTEEAMISDALADSSITDSSGAYSLISDSEIRSENDDTEIIDSKNIDWRKAVIYSEILKRRGI